MELKIEPYFCEEAKIDVVLTNDKFYIDATGKYLIIGYPGIDGVEFQIKNHSDDMTVYAFYPIEQEYTAIAKNPADLVKKWKTGTILL